MQATAQPFIWSRSRSNRNSKDPQLEHFAFKANDINDTLKKLQKSGAQYETRIVPGGKIRQVHAYDPDGNHVEIAFSTRDEANPKLLRGK